MMLVQGCDGAFYGEPCVRLAGGGYIAIDADDGPRIVLPKYRGRTLDGALRAGRRVCRTLGIRATFDEPECRVIDSANCGKPGWWLPFSLDDWINPDVFEYKCVTMVPSLSTPFIAFRMVFGKQVLVDCLGLERVPPLLAQWLTPGPGYVRRSADDHRALVAALTPLLPNYKKYKSIESYLESLPTQVSIDRRPKSRRVAPQVKSVGEPA